MEIRTAGVWQPFIMHRFRLAVATRCFDRPLRESLRLAADTGAEGVQFDLRDELAADQLTPSARRDLQHLLDELDLRVAGTTFSLRRGLFDPQELDRRVAAIKQAMSHSYELKSRVLTVRTGRLPTDPDDKSTQTLRDVLDDLGRHANHVGVTLALSLTREGPETLQQVLAATHSGPLGVDFDPSQLVMSGVEPVSALRLLHSFVSHLQLRDGLAEMDGAGTETPFGQGAVPWLEVLAMLGEMEYAGWLTAIRTQGSDKPGDLRRAIASVKRLLLGG